MRITSIALAMTLALGTGAAVAQSQSFSSLDTNGNGELSQDEFYSGAVDAGIFQDYDTSSDGLLDETEFNEIGADWDYNTWDADADGYVDADELYDGYYTYYDASEDGHWQSGEWDDAGDAGLFDW